tara:strand:- start:5630 stop:6142 length:513 start_codon:yes stop_codon:yes gene_type:complete
MINSNIFTQDNFFISLKGVFLSLLIFSASFLAPYVGCNFQEKLKTGKLFRYFLLFLVIYFSVNLVDPSSKKRENPIFSVIKSIFVLIIFMLLNMLSKTVLYLILTLFALLILTNNYYYYYHDIVVDKKKYKYVEDIIIAIQYGLSFSIFIILLVSFFTKKKLTGFSKCNI